MRSVKDFWESWFWCDLCFYLASFSEAGLEIVSLRLFAIYLMAFKRGKAKPAACLTYCWCWRIFITGVFFNTRYLINFVDVFKNRSFERNV